MKILIAIDCQYDYLSGVNTFLQSFIPRLQELGHEVLTIAPSASGKYELVHYDDVPVYGVRSFEIRIYESLRFSPPYLITKKLRKVIQDFDPDVIHIQTHFFIGSTVIKIAQELNIPIIGTNHGSPDNYLHHVPFTKNVNKLLRRAYWRDFYKKFNKLDAITTPTATAIDFFDASKLNKKVQPVSNGIDLDQFSKTHPSDILRKKFKTGDVPILLYVGRLDSEKHVDWIIKAMPRVLKKTDAYFVIIGTGMESDNLKTLVHNLKLERRVKFAGFVPRNELPKYYSSADGFVIAGTAETQSLVTLEAMASGLPVVAVNCKALPELVIPEKNGYLFEVKDIAELSNCIVKLLSNNKLRKKMSQGSLKIAKQHDIKKVAKTFDSLYKKVIHQKCKK